MKKRITVFITIITLLLSIGITYAYFTSDIGETKSKIKIASKELNVIFTDTKEISNLAIEPGWSDSKSFTVENKSNGTYNYNIVFSDLINTFVTSGSLQYKITSSNGGYNMEDFVDIPKSNTKDDKILVYDIDIEKGVTQEYTIEFRYYDNPDVDQSEDIGKDFSGSLMIAEGSIDPNKFYSVRLNVDNATIDNNPKETIKRGSVEFNVTPSTGFTMSEASVNCDGGASININGNQVTISNVTGSQTCTVTLKHVNYTVTVTSNNNDYGTVSPTSQSVTHGNNATITISPKSGYKYSSNDCGGTVSGNTMTISNITSAKSCSVTFEGLEYLVKANIYGGSISSSTSVIVKAGEKASFDITPNPGYVYGAFVYGENCGYFDGKSLITDNITHDTTCYVSLSPGNYEIKTQIYVLDKYDTYNTVLCSPANYIEVTQYSHVYSADLLCRDSFANLVVEVRGIVNYPTKVSCTKIPPGSHCSIYHKLKN